MKNLVPKILSLSIFIFVIYAVFYFSYSYLVNDFYAKKEPNFTSVKKNTPINISENSSQKEVIKEKIEENKDPNFFIKDQIENTFKNLRDSFLPYHPVRITKVDNFIYYLINGKLYSINLNTNTSEKLVDNYKKDEIDLVDIAYNNKDILFLLDKSNKIFSYDLKIKSFNLFFMPYSFDIEPDPQNISILFSNNKLYSLDSARNQIWEVKNNIDSNNKLLPFFKKEPLVWKLKKEDRDITNSYSFYQEKDLFYISKRNNKVDIYKNEILEKSLDFKKDEYEYLKIYSNPNIKEIYLIGGYNGNIIKIDKNTGNIIKNYYINLNNTNLPVYDFIIEKNKFFILAGNYLLIRDNLDSFENDSTPDILDNYLETKNMKDFIIPVKTKNIQMPSSAGMFPGARRLYRHGIHEGIDFFTASENNIFINKNTEVIGTQSGKIIRIDSNYKDLSESERQKILDRCTNNKNTSPQDADKLKGRQVIIQHENNIFSSYCHLSKVSNFKVGDSVKIGETIGYVGNSGTSDGVKNNNDNLHLHFEIHIDDNSKYKSYYLGKNISIEETILLYKKILLNKNF